MTQTVLDRLPHTRLVLMTILPAGDWRSNATRYDWPNHLSPGILSANRWCGLLIERRIGNGYALWESVLSLDRLQSCRLLEASMSEEKITLLDCSHLFLPHGKVRSAHLCYCSLRY